MARKREADLLECCWTSPHQGDRHSTVPNPMACGTNDNDTVQDHGCHRIQLDVHRHGNARPSSQQDVLVYTPRHIHLSAPGKAAPETLDLRLILCDAADNSAFRNRLQSCFSVASRNPVRCTSRSWVGASQSADRRDCTKRCSASCTNHEIGMAGRIRLLGNGAHPVCPFHVGFSRMARPAR
jgi:hypothetical protein